MARIGRRRRDRRGGPHPLHPLHPSPTPLLSLCAVLAVLLVGGCGGDDADVDFGGEDIGEDRFSVLSQDSSAKMGLTDRYVYFGLSDAAVDEVRTGLEAETDSGGVSGMIGGIVRGAVSKAISFRAKYPVEEVRDIRWEDGRMVIEFTDPDRRFRSENFEINDEPATEAFDSAAVTAFGEAFRRVKRQRAGGSGGTAGTADTASG